MQKAKTIRLSEQDKQAVAAIRAYYGLTSDNEAIRFALNKVWREIPPSPQPPLKSMVSTSSNKARAVHPPLLKIHALICILYPIIPSEVANPADQPPFVFTSVYCSPAVP